MAIASSKDIAEAVSTGRIHTQRFLKNAGSTGNSHWQDWSFASGQPAYDARIGDALTFTPFIASRNDAIYFPPIAAGEERYLLRLLMARTASGADQSTVDYQMYDLLGVYPLIDGDNTDIQEMTNDETLPRYTDGVGVRAILVNHVAPGITAGCAATINYVDSDDATGSVTVYTTTFGAGKAAASLQTTGASTGLLYLPTNGPGIKSVTDLTFAVAPGGLWAIYLVKPINDIAWQGGLNLASGGTYNVMAKKDLCSAESYALPRIYDGAWLGFFYLPPNTGTARTVASFGTATFIWK